MNTARRIQNLTLIGFMGTGKTSVGRLAADQLRFEYLDTDDVIEERAGKPITEIFTEAGEATFREMERALVSELAERTKTVISTGGGLPLDPANLASLKQHSLVVCLWASPEKIFERVGSQTHRPLLHGPNPLEKIRSLLAAREPFYRQANVLINTEMRSIKEVVQQIVYQFRSARTTGK